MAVQKKRKTRSRRDMRRSHDALGTPTLITDSLSGERRRRHHVSPDGFYRGRRVFEIKQKKSQQEDESQQDSSG